MQLNPQFLVLVMRQPHHSIVRSGRCRNLLVRKPTLTFCCEAHLVHSPNLSLIEILFTLRDYFRPQCPPITKTRVRRGRHHCETRPVTLSMGQPPPRISRSRCFVSDPPPPRPPTTIDVLRPTAHPLPLTRNRFMYAPLYSTNIQSTLGKRIRRSFLLRESRQTSPSISARDQRTRAPRAIYRRLPPSLTASSHPLLRQTIR